jgi:hypothetical protein
LEKNLPALKSKGLGVCAISYDTKEILASFAKRSRITFPLLSDWNSNVISKFKILNDMIPADQPAHGVPFPGTFLVDEKGIVVSKFFEEDYRDRYSIGTILTRFLNSSLNTRQTHLELDHLVLDYYASSETSYSGNRVTLVSEIQLPDGVHLYAPGPHHYRPVKWELKPSVGFQALPILYPESAMLYLPAIQETVPVFENKFRLTQDIIVTPNQRALPMALNSNSELTIDGTFHYQACDAKTCYLPETVPMRWTIKILELDTQRAPEGIRRMP